MPATTELEPTTLLREQQRGLDKLELALPQRKEPSRGGSGRRSGPRSPPSRWRFFIWQCVVWSGWKSEYILPGPVPVFETPVQRVRHADGGGVAHAATRASSGSASSIVLGTVIGAAVARIPVLRAAVGSMITGLQTMPSIAWFPPRSCCSSSPRARSSSWSCSAPPRRSPTGCIAGVDTIPPIMLRTGRVLGAQGFATFRYVILPAALPSFVGGLKQGWAFAWRSLLAGELLVLIPGAFSLGQQLQFSQEFSRYEFMYAAMIVILVDRRHHRLAVLRHRRAVDPQALRLRRRGDHEVADEHDAARLPNASGRRRDDQRPLG